MSKTDFLKINGGSYIMFCKYCGAALEEGETNCPECGKSISSEENETANDNVRTLKCTSCGGTDFKKIGRNEYICRYCGSRHFIEQGEKISKDPDAEAKLIAIFEEASAYEKNDMYKKELQVLSKGLQIDPDDCDLLAKLGRVYWRLGYLDRARKYLDKAVLLYPNDPAIYNNIGLLYVSKNMFIEAKRYIEKSIRLLESDPLSATPNDTAVIYGNYALCIGKLGDKQGAIQYLKIAKEKGYVSSSIANICKRLKIDPRNI